MPLLQVRECPVEIYEQIAARAKAERRTIAQQALVLIEGGLAKEEDKPGLTEKQREAFARALAGPMNNPSRAEENLAIIHEERENRMRRVLGEERYNECSS